MDSKHHTISVRRQCELLGLSRSSYYYQGTGESVKDLRVMRLIDEQYLRTPFFGSRQMARWLGREPGSSVNRKRVQRLMRMMGIEAIYPRQRTTRRNPEHRVFPCLLIIIRRNNLLNVRMNVDQNQYDLSNIAVFAKVLEIHLCFL